MSETRQLLPDIPALIPTPISSTMPSDALSTLTEPLLPVAASEEILTPDEAFDKSFAEIKEYVKAHGWDAAAMFFGTAVYMGVYYADAYFEIFGPAGRYVVHNISMGVAANLSVLPFVRQGRRYEGKTPAEANRDAFRYFLLCSLPDSLYQPVEDWFIAVSKSGSLVNFEFIQDAAAEFSPVEIAASFALFGVGFGLLYLVMKKLLIKHDEENEAVANAFDDKWQNLYKKCREMLQTPTWESIKSALQYFIFYLSDYFFDLSMNGATKTLLNLFGCCVCMAGYSFVFDNLPELFGYLEIRRARTLALQQASESSESLDSDYVNVTVTADSEEEDFAVLGDIMDRLVEPPVTNVVGNGTEASDLTYSLSTASTTSVSSLESGRSLSDSPRGSLDNDSDATANTTLGEDDGDLEILSNEELNDARQKTLPSDANNILPHSGQLLQKFRSIANTAIAGLAPVSIKPAATDSHSVSAGLR